MDIGGPQEGPGTILRLTLLGLVCGQTTMVRVADEGLSVMDPALRQAAYNKMYRASWEEHYSFPAVRGDLAVVTHLWARRAVPFRTSGLLLAWSIMAGMMRLGRSSMLEVLDSEFIKFARVKGQTESLAIWKHALRNALIPLIPSAG